MSTMHHHDHRRPFPRGALIAAGFLVAASLTLVGVSRIQQVWFAPQAEAGPYAGVTALATRDVQFIDEPGGGITVREAGSNALIAAIPSGEGGFIRGVMRGLARDRRAADIVSSEGFRLTLYPDGGLTLEDLATGRMLQLASFGPTNRDAFLAFLEIAPAQAETRP